MGILIHKVLGYGLTDYNDKAVIPSSSQQSSIDPRFNPNGWWGASWKERFTRWSNEGFIDHCKKLAAKEQYGPIWLSLSTIPHVPFLDIDGCIAYDEETNPNVIVFTPPPEHNWIRVDDTIDYYEANLQNSSTKVLDVPVWPYTGYINRETGGRVSLDIEQAIYLFRNANGDRMEELRQDVLAELGCKKHWLEKYNTAIPDILVEFFRYTEMFTDDKTIWQLQPMIYTYWA